jgi:curved DNA-binding protein CbpA
MNVNYYDVLGVKSSATDREIRDRFRQLARANHPDRYTGADKADAERKFQTLTEALNVLTNPNKRKQHDSELSSGGTGAAVDFAQIAKAYLSKGVKAYREKDWLTACANFDLAAKHNTQDAKAWHYLALAAANAAEVMERRRDLDTAKKTYRQAVQAIEMAVQLESVNPTFLRDAGKICRKVGLAAKAERYLEEALQWDPENVNLQNDLAELRQGRGDAGKGFTLFRSKG